MHFRHLSHFFSCSFVSFRDGDVMDITLERIVDELKIQNKKKLELTEYLGVVNSAFGNWVAGRNQSYKKYLHAIASFLNVSVEYLKGETDVKKPITMNKSISDDDIKFALFGDAAEEIPDEKLQEVKNFAQYIKNTYKKDT